MPPPTATAPINKHFPSPHPSDAGSIFLRLAGRCPDPCALGLGVIRGSAPVHLAVPEMPCFLTVTAFRPLRNSRLRLSLPQAAAPRDSPPSFLKKRGAKDFPFRDISREHSGRRGKKSRRSRVWNPSLATVWNHRRCMASREACMNRSPAWLSADLPFFLSKPKMKIFCQAFFKKERMLFYQAPKFEHFVRTKTPRNGKFLAPPFFKKVDGARGGAPYNTHESFWLLLFLKRKKKISVFG